MLRERHGKSYNERAISTLIHTLLLLLSCKTHSVPFTASHLSSWCFPAAACTTYDCARSIAPATPARPDLGSGSPVGTRHRPDSRARAARRSS